MSDPQQPEAYVPSYVPVRPRIPDSTPVYGPLIWLIALLPLLNIPVTYLARPEYRFSDVNGIRTLDPSSVFTPGYFAQLGLGLVLYGLLIVLSWRDRRELTGRGVERPFHWAWAFLASIVYVIGRSVIVHRVAAPRGLVPIWVTIAIFVISIGFGIATTVSSMSARMPYG